MSEVLNRLFELQAITGANVATDVPENIVDRCPLFVTYEGQGDEDYRTHGQEAVEETTVYVMALYVASLTEHTAEWRYERAREFIRRVRIVFAPRRRLEILDEDGDVSALPFDATYAGYRGPVAVPYPQGSENQYLTVYFRVVVGEIHLQDYDFDVTFEPLD